MSVRIWSKKTVPHKGWKCLHVRDLRYEQGDDYTPEICEMCGKENLRFVHTMRHPKYAKTLDVGRVCAGKMESDYARPQLREQRLVSRYLRRQRFLTRKWNPSRKGNLFINMGEYNIVVYHDKYVPDQWRFRISDRENTIFSQESYEDLNSAKLAAFDELADQLGW
jgi:hypothetical protein